MYICIYVNMYICKYVYTYICIYVYMYIWIYEYMYVCMYIICIDRLLSGGWSSLAGLPVRWVTHCPGRGTRHAEGCHRASRLEFDSQCLDNPWEIQNLGNQQIQSNMDENVGCTLKMVMLCTRSNFTGENEAAPLELDMIMAWADESPDDAAGILKDYL